MLTSGPGVSMTKNNLRTYHNKRKFNQTPEPRGKKSTLKTSTSAEITTFVVQKHDASHLHYDFRIHIGDVLPSWAVPKGFPKVIGEKRLAVKTEDHPVEYAHFQGTIPPGNYGAGTVEIWDQGTCENIKMHVHSPISFKKSLTAGTLEFRLTGKRLKGTYALVRTNLQAGKSWLLIKIKAKPKA